MSKENPIVYSYLSTANLSSIHWNINHHNQFQQEATYDASELAPLWPVVLQLLLSSDLPLDSIQSGHVHFNPYASPYNIFTRQVDPLRPNQKIDLYNLGLASPPLSVAALQKLEQLKARQDQPFFIATYPTLHDYGTYINPAIQTVLGVFDVRLTPQEWVKKYPQIVADTYHMKESVGDGSTPLANLHHVLELFIHHHVLTELHFQPVRSVESNQLDSEQITILQGLTGYYPDYTSPEAQLLHLVKSADYLIPIVIEITLKDLIQAGIVETKNGFFVNWNQVIQAHAQIADFIRRV